MNSSFSKDALSNVFVAAGLMGEKIRDYQWSDSSLGPIESWPQSLHSALSICVNSNFPIAIYWGPDLVLIYNDAWSPIPGSKHPWALGKPAIEVWPEIWNDIEPQFKKAFAGMPGGSKDALLPMQRHGYTEECYFDFTFTPIYGESGKVEGIFNAVIETTYRVINERRATLLRKLSDIVNSITTSEMVFSKASAVLNHAQADVPFYYIIEFISEGKNVRAKSENTDPLSNHWPIDAVGTGSIIHIPSIDNFSLHIPQGYWPEKPTEAVIVPLKGNDGHVFGCIIGGLSARRKYDEDYRSFYESIAVIIGGELNTIRSLDVQRERAEALAQMDRAKTAFFSNISHEFRTPLTLMLGPLQDILEGEELKHTVREHLSTSYRNTLRLLKLVNSLLDFSRIEAGKMDVQFHEVNLSKYTKDLASSFRSAIELAGIEYTVTVQEPGRNVQVDVNMWERIVLNLISNAFKYTQEGRIEVQMIENVDTVVLKVADTGAGIRIEDQSKIFDRFYRVANSGGRSQEGTGIGLSMVKELVNLHHGEILLESEFGKGSTFIVTLPTSQGVLSLKPHLQSNGAKDLVKSQFIEEALQWTRSVDLKDQRQPQEIPSINGKRARVLLADDNRDMRDYVQRLLQNEFDIQTVTNGEEAFVLALDWPPDLILCDIMMPKLDGFGLLNKLKGNMITRNIPVVFLSARSGEEARVEGINAGADDYLVKPFSARELIARVTNRILISQTRRKTEKEFYNLFLQSPFHIHVMKGPDHVMEFFHPFGKKFTGGRDLTGMKIREALPEVEGQGYFEMLDQVFHEGKSFFIEESKASLPGKDGNVEDFYFNITYLPLKGIKEKIEGVLQFTLDVTHQANTNQKIRESEERFRLLVTSIPQIIWIADNNSNIEFLSQQWESYTGVGIAEGRAKFSSFIHPDDIGMVREKWFESIRMKKPWQSEYRLRDTRTNEYRWFFGHTLPLVDESGDVLKWIGSAADIHAQKTANQELEKIVAKRTSELVDLNKKLKAKNEELSAAQIFLQTVLDSSVELVTAFDKNLNLTFINNRLKEFSPRIPEQLVGKSIFELYTDFEKTEGYQYLKRALQGETVHIEAGKSKIDESRIFETFIIPLKRQGKITGVVTMQRDITAIVNLTESLKISNEELKRSNEDLQQFAHVTSHDLKEPVRKIKLFSTMLKKGFSNHLPENGIDLLNKIERATNRISSMIDGVLQYSSLESVDGAFERLDLNSIITGIIEDLEISIKESDATIKFETLPIIKGSATLIHQLFYNLINNSLKFRKQDQKPVITIRYEHASKQEETRLNGNEEYIRIDVQDNGIGFDQLYADRIFEAFSRLNSKDTYEGTGLGLALCKKIVLRHNGFIVATSSPNAGATFSIFFPKAIVVS